MADLGEFGRARAIEHGETVEPDIFRLYGERFEVPAGLSSLVMLEFAHDAKACRDAEAQASARLTRARASLERASTDTARALAQDDVVSAQVDQKTANVDAAASMYRYIRACVGEHQWDRFRAVALANALDDDDLMTICALIFEAVAARPTRRPSTTADGPSNTGDGSTGGSVSPEPTPGPMGQVVEMTPAQRQKAEFRRLMNPVSAAELGIPSSG